MTKLHRALNHPSRILRKASTTLVRPFVNSEYKSINFLNEDWDILIILDACRYDLLKDNSSFQPRVEAVHSNSSHTREFIKKNLSDRDCRDIAYVTASPQFADFDLDLAYIEHVWADQWDSNLRTVPPSAVTDSAIEIANKFNKKRIVVHYMQPHYPFIGEEGQEIDNQATFGGDAKRLSVWEQLRVGNVSEETVKEAYRENLSLVIPEVKRLSTVVSGKTVVTSDHGNLFGTSVCWLPIRVYGHPPGIHHPELTKVPWIELPHDSRRKINKSHSSFSSNISNKSVKNKLADLGYV